MARKLAIGIFMVLLAGTCLAQDGLVVRANRKQQRPVDAEKIYFAACLAVEREFRISRPLRPQVTLVLGADEDEAYWGSREIRLTKWNPNFFAQGVVLFAFEDLLPDGERMVVAKRAVAWVDSTVDAKNLAK